MDLQELTAMQMTLTAFGCLAAGYVIFLGMLFMLPRRLRAENLQQKEAALKKAAKQKTKILEDAVRVAEERLITQKESMESELEEKKEALLASESELDILADTVKQTESRLAKRTKEVETRKQKVANLERDHAKKVSEAEASKETLRNALEKYTDINIKESRERIVQETITERSLASQKSLRDYADELSSHAPKLANRMLSRLCSRYAPTFAWPKSSYVVDIKEQKTFDDLNTESYSLLDDLRELTEGVTIGFTTDKEDTPSMGIKLVGGYGIYKEAGRLTLEEILNRGPGAWSKVEEVYKKHRQTIENQALKLGQQAVLKLQLDGVHQEILRMVGALNWRTSYRQNQYLHSVEVSELAGILAHEIGVSPDEAKRCGLLHDIGKGIDYRIEGSHAIISGDYADRFGESQLICDTVMSHHNDLVLETPMSYVLKTADTLSGARPGARVNLEEGYQIRLSAIDQAVRSFQGVQKVNIMSGGREVHVEVNHKKVLEHELKDLAESIARKIEEDVAFPGQIKVQISRKFEASCVA